MSYADRFERHDSGSVRMYLWTVAGILGAAVVLYALSLAAVSLVALATGLLFVPYGVNSGTAFFGGIWMGTALVIGWALLGFLQAVRQRRIASS